MVLRDGIHTTCIFADDTIGDTLSGVRKYWSLCLLHCLFALLQQHRCHACLPPRTGCDFDAIIRVCITVIKGSNSEALSVTHGVIQGSLLGPKLFSIFTNDLAPHIANGKLVMYADDCQFLDSDSPDELGMLKERVESTLKIALKWFTQNRLKINPNKTELLVIKSRQRKHIEHISITFGNNVIHPSPHAKILGVYVDSSLSWEKTSVAGLSPLLQYTAEPVEVEEQNPLGD